MYKTILLISLLSYIGTFASVISSTLMANKMKLPYLLQFLVGITTTFWSGIFLRDLILLKTTPVAFSSPLEIALAAIVCISVIIILKHKKPKNSCLSILRLLDSIGIVGSVVTGYTQGAHIGILMAFACGFVTVCGGTILTTAIQMTTKKNIKSCFKTLADNKWYFLFDAFITIGYGIMHLTKLENNTTIIILTAIAITIGFIIERHKAK